jgi:AcrR family transcriptional regulator
MPRPRFHRLPAEQQTAILGSALAEFAAYGFADASLNRIIESAGISKGSMYYYFDGKDDLYTHVIRVQLEQLIVKSGPAPDFDNIMTPDTFWTSLEAYYLHLMRMLAVTPDLASLLRGWLSGPAAIAPGQAQRDAEQLIAPWLLRTISAGQAAGAVRTDLPIELIVAIAMNLGQTIDTWLISQPTEDANLDAAIHTLLSIMRRALQP